MTYTAWAIKIQHFCYLRNVVHEIFKIQNDRNVTVRISFIQSMQLWHFVERVYHTEAKSMGILNCNTFQSGGAEMTCLKTLE